MSSEPNAEPTIAVGIRRDDTDTSGNTLIRQSVRKFRATVLDMTATNHFRGVNSCHKAYRRGVSLKEY